MKLLNCASKKILAIVMIASLTGGILVNAAGGSESVSVSINNVPTVDVMLSTKYSLDYIDDFEDDLRKELRNLGINDKNIVITSVNREYSAIEDSNLNFSEAVNEWESIGAPIFRASGDTIYCDVVGQENPRSGAACPNRIGDINKNFKDMNIKNAQGQQYTADWTAALINPNEYEADKIKIKFTVERNGNLNNGIAFFLNRIDGAPNNDHFSGYYFNVTSHAYYGATDDPNSVEYSKNTVNENGETNYCLNLYKIENYDLDQSWGNTIVHNVGHCLGESSLGSSQIVASDFGNSSISILAKWYMTRKVGTYCNYEVEAGNGHIVIKADGNIVADVYDNQFTQGTYGFVGLNCERSASMVINSFITEVEKKHVKDYAEVLMQPSWRDEAHHVVVNIDDDIDNSIIGESEGEVLTRTLNDYIHFIQWGTDKNKRSIENFIKKNDNRGEFLYNNDYNTCVKETAIYIKKLLDQEENSQYIIMNTPIDFDVTPPDLKENAVSDDFKDGRWIINHDSTYFDNDLGVHILDNTYIKDLLCEFNKPGKYDISFDDTLIETLYVHRKPKAKFEAKFKDGEWYLDSSMSYDLDSNKRIRNDMGLGIAEEYWEYQIEDGPWLEMDKDDTNFILQNINAKYIVIRLIVTDFQGETNYISKVFNIDKPISYFDFEINPENIGNEVRLVNESYSPTGLNLIKYDWSIYKPNGSIFAEKSSKNPSFIPNEDGEWKVSLKVTDELNRSSETYVKKIIIEDIDYELRYMYNYDDRYPVEEYETTKKVTWHEELGNLTNPSAYYILKFNYNEDSSYFVDTNEYVDIKSNSIFLGWYYDKLFNVKVSESDIVENKEPFNIYAKWQNNPIESPIYTDIKREYIVEYDEGDNGQLATPSSATRTSDICKYDFLGWYDGDKLYSKGGDTPVLSENKTLDPHWKANSITLPNININSDASGKFLGWFTEPQNFENAAQAQYVGKAGDEIVVSIGPDGARWENGSTKGLYKYNPVDMYTPFKLYAWYNKTPVFVNLYDGLFFEGQEVSYNDLLELIATWDYEEEYKKDKLDVVDEYFKDMLIIIDNEKDDIKEQIDYIIEEERENLGGSDDSYTEELEELRENLRNVLKQREEVEKARRKALKDVETKRLEPVISKIVYGADNEELSYYTNKTSSDGIKIAEKTKDYDKTYINTSTSKIGWLDITYQVHDDGIYYVDITDDSELEDDIEGIAEDVTENENLVKIPNSDITVEYTRKCQINFNYNPLMNLQNMIYDKDFNFEGKSLSEFVISRQAIRDSEDLENNTPWWSTKDDSEDLLLHKNNENTLKNMQDTIKITGINEILFSSVFENEDKNKDAIEHFRKEFISTEKNLDSSTVEDKSDLLNDLYAFKISNEDYYGVKKSDIWGAISGISLTLDGKDQFGKYASNKLSSKYNYTIPNSTNMINVDVLHGAPSGYMNPEFNGGYKPNLIDDEYDRQIYQTNFERTIWLILLNPEYDSSLNYTRVKNNIRYIDLKNYERILSESYWWTTGSEKLEAALNKIEMTDEQLNGLDTNEYNGNFGNNKVRVKDYTN